MLWCHAYNASHACDARGPCVCRADGMEVGGRQRRDALLRSRHARCDQDRAQRRAHNDSGTSRRVFGASSARRIANCRTALSQFRDHQPGARRDHSEHGWSGANQCARRSFIAKRSHATAAAGRPACCESRNDQRFLTERDSAWHAYSKSRDPRSSRCADSRDEYGSVPRTARIDSQSASGTVTAHAAETAADFEQVADLAALLRFIERQARADRSGHQYASEASSASAHAWQTLASQLLSLARSSSQSRSRNARLRVGGWR